MARREVRVFLIDSIDPEEIRDLLIDTFPDFLRKCSEDKATHRFHYNELGNARFEKMYGYTIIDWLKQSFYNPSKEKHQRRKLNISKGSDI